jgi:hypothetical protein
MKSILQVLKSSPVSNFTGSEATRSIVEDFVKTKYGPAEIKNIDCHHNCRSFSSWSKMGWKIRRGEKAIKSFTITEVKDSEGNLIRKVKRPCYLFYYRQVEPIEKSYGKENNNNN